MKHAVPRRRNTYDMYSDALETGWHPIDSLPRHGEGAFLVLTLSGLVRMARNKKGFRRARTADSYGPARISVIAVDSGNYLSAIAWKWPDD